MSNHQHHTLNLAIGKDVNLLQLTEATPEASPQDCVSDFTCAQGTKEPSSSSLTDGRQVIYHLPSGAYLLVNFETGNVTWRGIFRMEGSIEVQFNRINSNRRQA